MAIATSKTREQFPLSTKKIFKKTIEGSLIWLVLLAFLYGIFLYLSTTIVNAKPEPIAVESINNITSFLAIIMPLIIVFFFAIVLLQYLYQRWYFSVYFYDLTPDYIVIRKGPILPREITIPYERVQDVYVDQDFMDRLFGLYDVHLSSATISSGMEAHIDGLEKPAADGLRKEFLEIVSKRISKEHVEKSS